MNKVKLKKISVLFMSLFITIQAISLVLLSNINMDVEVERELNDLPNKSGLIPYSIVINDTDPALSWAAWEAKNPSWLSGNGLQGTPYIIKDIIIDGRGNNESCIVVKNSRKYFELDNVTCKNAASGGFARGGLYIYNSTNGNVHDSFFLDNAEAGIQLENSTDCKFENNYIEGGNKYGFWSQDHCKQIDFMGNIVNKTTENAIHITQGSWFNIENNLVNGSSQYGISLDYFDNSTVLGNNVTFSQWAAIMIINAGGDNLIKDNIVNWTANGASGILMNGNAPKDIKRVEISYNKIYDVGEYGISVAYCEWVTISNNYINNSVKHGIWVYSAAHNTTVNRNIVENSQEVGIFVGSGASACINCTVYENLINKTGTFGIQVFIGSDSANITRNIILNSTSTGILLYSKFCIVHWNDVNGSGDYGINVEIRNCKITYNTIYYSNNYGVTTDDNDIKVYLNNFIKNRVSTGPDPDLPQGYDDGGSNVEYNSSTHGNYWSNHLDRYPNSQPCPAPNDYCWNFGYSFEGGLLDNRSLVKQTRGPLSWPMVDPTLDVTPVSALITKVRCASVNVQWKVEYDAFAIVLNYEIYVNDTLVKASSITREKISDGISYQNSTLYEGDWKVTIVVEDGMGLQDSSDVLIRNIAPLTITAEEYPKTAFEVGNTSVIINWTVAVEAGVSLTKIEIYVNGSLNATIMVGTGEGQWNYSALKPYYIFSNLSLLPVGVYYFSCRVYYTIDGNTCSWDSTAILVNVTEAAADGGPGFIIPGYDLLIVMGIIFVGTIVFYKKKAKKIEAG